MKKAKGIFLELLQGLLPYSFASRLGRHVHAYGRTSVTWVEIEEVDATEGCFGIGIGIGRWLIFYNQAQLTIAVDIAGCGSDVITQILLRERIMVRSVRPNGRIVLPLIEKREIGRL